MKHEHSKHLYWRLSFGASPAQILQTQDRSRANVVDSEFIKSKDLGLLSIDLSEFKILRKKGAKKEIGEEKYRELTKKAGKTIRKLSYMWIEHMPKSDAGLREKMTLFWTNVFVCRDNDVWNTISYHNMLRKHAMGNFGDFLKAMAREPAMLKYLNNNKNFKTRPNENFARELMELFTLGIGNYSEEDIKEAARAFTGWSYDNKSQFHIRPGKHDSGLKTFLAKTGNWNGDDIIDIILKQKACARFICAKIYRYFVNPIIDETHLEELINHFYSDYNIEKLMRYIFMSDWFYESKNIGSKIKSPIELLVGINRTVPVSFKKKKQLNYLQRMMGQVLFYPPNVAGWKGDRSWIDANTLLFRMNLASALLNKTEIEYQEKAEFEDSFEVFYKAKAKRKMFLKLDVNWEVFENEYQGITGVELQSYILAGKMDSDTETFVKQIIDTDLRNRCVQIMSLPEYQMC